MERTNPPRAQRMVPGCNHAPLPNLEGLIVSPSRDYGRGLPGTIVCKRCGRQISEADAREALGLGPDDPM